MRDTLGWSMSRGSTSIAAEGGTEHCGFFHRCGRRAVTLRQSSLAKEGFSVFRRQKTRKSKGIQSFMPERENRIDILSDLREPNVDPPTVGCDCPWMTCLAVGTGQEGIRLHVFAKSAEPADGASGFGSADTPASSRIFQERLRPPNSKVQQGKGGDV